MATGEGDHRKHNGAESSFATGGPKSETVVTSTQKDISSTFRVSGGGYGRDNIHTALGHFNTVVTPKDRTNQNGR